MKWENLLSLNRHGDTQKRNRKEQDDIRIGYDSDYDRIIFSSAFRSLQDKTQVIPLSKTDFVHTRLTHSLEVSVVGRSLGRIVGKKILEKYPYLIQEYGHNFNDFGNGMVENPDSFKIFAKNKTAMEQMINDSNWTGLILENVLLVSILK